jgi:uncharacterized protein (UPF0303 family)
LRHCGLRSETPVLSEFDEQAAYSLGIALRAKCEAVGTPVVIDIRPASRRLFFAALPSSAAENDDWARHKGNVVLRRDQSSMLAGEILKSENRSQWPDPALDVKDFALHGGGFPVRARGVGVVASIAISGLQSHQDHDMNVTTLAEYPVITDVAWTPRTANSDLKIRRRVECHSQTPQPGATTYETLQCRRHRNRRYQRCLYQQPQDL